MPDYQNLLFQVEMTSLSVVVLEIIKISNALIRNNLNCYKLHFNIIICVMVNHPLVEIGMAFLSVIVLKILVI